MLLQPDLPWDIGPNNEYDDDEKVLRVKSTFYSFIIGALEASDQMDEGNEIA